MDTVVSSGVDYYSGGVSAGSDNRNGSSELAMSILFDLHSQGARLETYRRLGYEGSYCVGAFYGEREQDTLWQFPGGVAHEAFIALAPWQERCSRIDLQVTVRYDDFNPTMVEEQYERFKSKERRETGVKARQYELISNTKGGSTLYIGSKASDWYICIYNKGAQSGEEQYKDCWRFEVRYKNRYASQVSQGLRKHISRLAEATHTHMERLIRRNGMEVRFLVDTSLQIDPPKAKVKSEIYETLTWIEKSVRPAINRLRKLGVEREAIRALGLGELLDIGAIRD